jgi:hypothetical protein
VLEVCDIDWNELLKVLAALLSPLIATLTVYIAWQQWKTNRRREIRESRQSKLDVYRRIKLLLRQALYSPTLDRGLYADFRDACAEADFLFDTELRAWIAELQDIAAHCMVIQEPMEDLAPDADIQAINKWQSELDELTEKLRTASSLLRDKFAGEFRKD